jgi:ABC-type glycerol-3-phosphate transport system permease component
MAPSTATAASTSASFPSHRSHRLRKAIGYVAAYTVLIGFGFLVIFPFLVMLFTSLKEPADTFSYPPRLLPQRTLTTEVAGFDQPLPLYRIEMDGETREMALAQTTVRVGVFAPPDNLEATITVPSSDVSPTAGADGQATVTVDGVEQPLFDVPVEGQVVPMVRLSQTALGRFVDPQDPSVETLANVRLSPPVTQITARPQNYTEVLELNGMGRALINTALVTLLVVLGQLVTSVLGGYAFARLRFPGRDALFVLYLGTIMIPFVVLIMPLYQLMVLIGWTDRLAALIIPWVFTAYGTFLMRQFFLTIPREIEEAALIDGASRLQILWRIFIPAATPALATLATFTFLYAWNSFFWPLVIINTGNTASHVLTLALNVLRGRAADSPNIVLAGAAISVLPPMILFILAQRFFIESATSSGVKG